MSQSALEERPTRVTRRDPLPMARLKAELETELRGYRWGPAMMSVGWIHLAVFLACQGLYSARNFTPILYLGLWFLELVAVVASQRVWLKKGWAWRSTLIGLAFRVWITFLILSFNLASMNTLMGGSEEWFKPAWATLSTFVFMCLAYFCSPWFFAGAVQMYFTGLLMVKFPGHCYLIYGVSWWLALQVMGGWLIHRNRRPQPLRVAVEPAPG